MREVPRHDRRPVGPVHIPSAPPLSPTGPLFPLRRPRFDPLVPTPV